MTPTPSRAAPAAIPKSLDRYAFSVVEIQVDNHPTIQRLRLLALNVPICDACLRVQPECDCRQAQHESLERSGFR